MSYGKPCPHGCGATLDPDERCDCQDAMNGPNPDAEIVHVQADYSNPPPESFLRKSFNIPGPISETFTIGVDMATNGDIPVVIVAKINLRDNVRIVKTFTDNDARLVYDLLTVHGKTIKQILEEFDAR